VHHCVGCPEAHPGKAGSTLGARAARSSVWCQARRLTRAWSWRAPFVEVEFPLCAPPHPDPAGAGAPARIAPAAQARSVRRRASTPQAVLSLLTWYGSSAGRRSPRRAVGQLLAAPHHPTAARVPRRAPPFGRWAGRVNVPIQGGRGLQSPRGALVRRGRARRLTCAWSWRRPPVGVEFHL
jgi:hypothetical protein